MDISWNYKRLEERNYLEEHKKIIDKTKSGEKVLGLEVLEVVLVLCSLVDDQYQ